MHATYIRPRDLPQLQNSTASIPWPYVFESYVRGIFKLEAKDESPSPYRPSITK